MRGEVAITIKDVAREAEVSVATVSRALNGRDNVAPEVRAHVRSVAARLRYVPHSGARSLITRRTQTIGALLPDMYGEFFSELIRGIDRAARAHGYHLLLSSSHGDAGETAAALQAMLGRVDGLLIMSPHADPGFIEEHLPETLPAILLNPVRGHTRLPALAVDNRSGAFAMTRHLVHCGHREIAFIAGPKGNLDAEERLQGYLAALHELLPGAEAQIVAGDFTEESGYRAGSQIARQKRLPRALFAANDSMAIGCLFALREAGLRVPEDMALAGFDDIPTARFTQPPLTTVRVRIADLGGRALDQLVATAAEKSVQPQAHSVLMLAPELVLRASCGMHNHVATAPAVASMQSSTEKRARVGPDARRRSTPAAPKNR